VVWYQPLAEGLAGAVHHVVGLTWTEDDTVLTVLDRGVVREFALDGTLVREIVPDDPDQLLHHDVFRREGRTWALSARVETIDGQDWIVDGVAGFDADGTQWLDWSLGDLATPSGSGGIGLVYWADDYPNALDWAHTNGLWVAEDGDFVISLHSFSTVLRIEGDPADPAFGAPVWSLDGSGRGPFASTFAVVDPDGITDDDVFGHQHHPTLVGDDGLRLFDNGDLISGNARGLELGLDPAAGEAAITGSWPLGEICPIEGGVFPLSNGDPLLTCAVHARFTEVDRGSGEVVSSTTATCAGATAVGLLPRAIPLDW
jgi:hypothetical protein